MKTWILQNIDRAPHSLALRMDVALRLLDTVPGYRPPVEHWQAELARHDARARGIAATPAPCIPHATWCARFGLPTDEATCAACTAAREDMTRDDATGLTRAALHIQRMRDAGIAYGAATCQHRQETGEYREERCCGGRVKQVPIVRCAKTGREADCRGCREKLAQGVVSTKSGA